VLHAGEGNYSPSTGPCRRRGLLHHAARHGQRGTVKMLLDEEQSCGSHLPSNKLQVVTLLCEKCALILKLPASVLLLLVLLCFLHCAYPHSFNDAGIANKLFNQSTLAALDCQLQCNIRIRFWHASHGQSPFPDPAGADEALRRTCSWLSHQRLYNRFSLGLSTRLSTHANATSGLPLG
jgi:hypothetical protein